VYSVFLFDNADNFIKFIIIIIIIIKFTCYCLITGIAITLLQSYYYHLYVRSIIILKENMVWCFTLFPLVILVFIVIVTYMRC